MFDISDPQTFWVNTTNIVLGLVTLCCAAPIGSVVINELLERWVGRVLGSTAADGHTIAVRGLGVTMADGGEPVDDESKTGVDYYGF
jgi:hypothetical protein